MFSVLPEALITVFFYSHSSVLKHQASLAADYVVCLSVILTIPVIPRTESVSWHYYANLILWLINYHLLKLFQNTFLPD